MHYSLVSALAAEPISPKEARRHLRLLEGDGEPAPLAPAAALAGDGAGNLSEGAYRYQITFVTSDGETEAGAASAAVIVADAASDGKIALSSLPRGGSAVTSRNIYRTQADGAAYFLAGTISDNTTVSYVDDAADASLGTEAPTINTTEDPYLLALIATARAMAEAILSRKLVTQTLELTLDGFPCGAIGLRRPPVQSVESVAYIDANGTERTLSPDIYDVSLHREIPEIRLKDGEAWPETANAPECVTVRFVAGYGDSPADVPYPIRQAILLVVGHLYENREDVSFGAQAAELPKGAGHLLSPYKIWRA
ncbi:MAG: head-tail connector protein [Rickettsiales bacterium]